MKVYVTRKLPDQIIKNLASCFQVEYWNHEDIVVPRKILLEAVKDASGLLCLLTDTIDQELMGRAPQLKIVANMAVGYDNIDISHCTKAKIPVTNTPGVLTETTADLAFALLMATARRIPEAQNFLLDNNWQTWSPMLLTGQNIYGTTLGIVGMGRIGTAVAKRAPGFGMNVIYYSKSRNIDAENQTGATFCPLDSLLNLSDFVSLHLPLTDSTKKFIGYRELGLMKPTSILINTSRGAVVDEVALYKALKDHKIWAAGLDVFQTEPLPSDNLLKTLPNVVLLPHIGSATIQTRTAMAVLAGQNIKEYLINGKTVTPVNPEVLEKHQ